MSREERRQYQRQMKSMERGAVLPPAARARAERNAQRRAGRSKAAPTYAFTTRFLVAATLIALALGLAAFSLQWPHMPFALYVGLSVAIVALAVQVGIRLLRRRAAAR